MNIRRLFRRYIVGPKPAPLAQSAAEVSRASRTLNTARRAKRSAWVEAHCNAIRASLNAEQVDF